MILTNENYFSSESKKIYSGVSEYKDFFGTIGRTGCEAMALAKINGEWEMDTKSTALLVGSYVDAHFEGTLDIFRAQNPEIFKKNGELKADYLQANEIIARIERDDLFMQHMSGEKQVIQTAEMFGVKWKTKIDSYLKGKGIVDLKVMKSIREHFWTRDFGYLDFIQHWGYDIQGAIYQEVDYQNTGVRLPFFIAAASKEKVTDIELIWIPDDHLREKLIEVETNAPKLAMLKAGEIKPIRCETCDYCKSTRVLTKAIHFTEVLGVI